jgi:hypothetical protein
MTNLIINQEFTATDRLHRAFKYRYLGTENTPNGYDIKLLNLNDNSFTYVEPEWFNQRSIK